MIMPNMNFAENGKTERVTIGYDIAAKYYVIGKCETIIQDGVHLDATKTLVLTIEQMENLKEQINKFFGAHNRL